MKRTLIIAIVIALIIAAVSAILITGSMLPADNDGANNGEAFYVGVTYCGNSVDDAKLLVDKVKDYTNMFVLDSGPLMTRPNDVNAIGDYAVSQGLHFAVFCDTSVYAPEASWVANASQRWDDMFGGVYYADESGGKMLDTPVSFVPPTGFAFIKQSDGTLNTAPNDKVDYYPNGIIQVDRLNLTDPQDSNSDRLETSITYYPNGSITLRERLSKYIEQSYQEVYSNYYTQDNGSKLIAQEKTYPQMQNENPIPNVDVAASFFINKTGGALNGFSSYWNLSSRSYPIFTADYGLYWWNFKSGYDMVLGELGWNNSVNQEIGLVRGAANLQGKDWGTILTWKYMQPPYLCGGDEMYQQLKASYEAGAKYVLIFNYAKDMTAPYGTLQQEHFDALQRFWNDEALTSNATCREVKAEAAFVLPQNYGWGMRNPQDKIWGIWQPDEQSSQIWSNLQAALTKYGAKLDIVYEDPAYPVAGRYSQVIYWNQTG